MAQKILIVDDSPSMRALEKTAMQKEGFEVITAQDGAKALKIVNHQELDMIITDINMPNMDGIAFTQEVRNGDSKNKFVPILVVTTEGGMKMKTSGKVAGASGWVVKPFTPETLIAAVKKLLKIN